MNSSVVLLGRRRLAWLVNYTSSSSPGYCSGQVQTAKHKSEHGHEASTHSSLYFLSNIPLFTLLISMSTTLPSNSAQQAGVWGVPSVAGGVAAALLPAQSLGDAHSERHPVGGDVRSDGTFDITSEQEEHVTALARTVTRSHPDLARTISRASTTATHVDASINPYVDSSGDPELDPNSGKFNARKWIKHLITIHSVDATRYPGRTAGVSWKHLNVYGYGTDTDYQADVGNVWLKMFESLKSLVGLSKQRRITILSDFEGLVRAGEMLVVLGRPGRYVIHFV
jgi:hypothetical protein